MRLSRVLFSEGETVCLPVDCTHYVFLPRIFLEDVDSEWCRRRLVSRVFRVVARDCSLEAQQGVYTR
jgi:hypothetical protein